MPLEGPKEIGVIRAIGETYMLNRHGLRLRFKPSGDDIDDDELRYGVVRAALQLIEDGDNIAYAYYDGDLYERRVIKRRKGEVLFASEQLNVYFRVGENVDRREIRFDSELDVRYYEASDPNLHTYEAYILETDAESVANFLKRGLISDVDVYAKESILIPGERFYAVLSTMEGTQRLIEYDMRREVTVRGYELYLGLDEEERLGPEGKELTVALYIDYGDKEPFRVFGDGHLSLPNAVKTYPVVTYVYYPKSNEVYGAEVVDVERLGRA